MNIQEILRGLIDVVDQKAQASAASPAPGAKGKVAIKVDPVGDVGLIPVEIVVNDNIEPDQTVMIPPGQAEFEMLKKDSELNNVYDDRGIELEKNGSGVQQVSTNIDDLINIQRLAGLPVISVTN